MSDAAKRVWGGKGPPWRGQKYTGPPLGKVLHLYVDFFSPYGYLGSLGLDEIADHYGCTVEWHPMLLGKSYFGPTSVMKMPAVPSIPMKVTEAMVFGHNWQHLSNLCDCGRDHTQQGTSREWQL